MRKIKFQNIIKITIILISILYIFYPTNKEEIEKKFFQEQTVVKEVLIKENNLGFSFLYKLFSTFKNSGFVSIINNKIILTTTNQNKQNILNNVENILSTQSGEIICVKYNKNTFGKTKKAQEIIKKYGSELDKMIGTGTYINGGIFDIPKNVLVFKKNQITILNDADFEKYFGKHSQKDVGKYITSKIPYPTGNGVFMGFNFKDKVFSRALLKGINTINNNINIKQQPGEHLIFSIVKYKKKGTGLIINKYNNKALNSLIELSKSIQYKTIEDINIENENLFLKNNTYGANGFFKNINDFIKNENLIGKNLKSKIIYSNGDISIIENDDEYKLIIYDKNDRLLKSKQDILEKMSMLKKTFIIGEEIYLLDTTKFRKIDQNQNNKENCDFKIINGMVVN